MSTGNPYPANSPLAKVWNAGFRDGDADYKGVCAQEGLEASHGVYLAGWAAGYSALTASRRAAS